MPKARALQVMVLGVGPRIGGRWRFWAWALASPGGGPGGRWWSVSLPVLAVLAASGVSAAPRHSWSRVPWVMLVARVVQVMVLSVFVAWALQVLYRMTLRVRVV